VFAGADEVRQFLPDIDDEFSPNSTCRLIRQNSFMPICSGSRAAGSARNFGSAGVAVQRGDALAARLRHQLEIDSHVIIDGRYYFEPGLVIHPTGGVGGGLGQLMQWREIATKLGVRATLRVAVTALLGNDRQINGVRVSDPNEEYEIQTHSLILCAGGFQASAEMRARLSWPQRRLDACARQQA